MHKWKHFDKLLFPLNEGSLLNKAASQNAKTGKDCDI